MFLHLLERGASPHWCLVQAGTIKVDGFRQDFSCRRNGSVPQLGIAGSVREFGLSVEGLEHADGNAISRKLEGKTRLLGMNTGAMPTKVTQVPPAVAPLEGL